VQNSEMIPIKEASGSFGRKIKYYVCSFEIRVIAAPADLRFELCFAGRKFSRNHKPIDVKWDEAETQLDCSMQRA
jgi:hypothetical protein